jgi:hypothetical protein
MKANNKPPRRKPKPKATKATARARVEDCARVIIDGAQFFQIREYVRERERDHADPWGVPEGGKPLSDSQIRRYCQRAEQLIGESCKADREATIRRHLAQRRALFARAVAKGDERTALACARDEAELLALYPAARHEVTGANGGPVLTVAAVAQLSESERLDQLRRLIAAAKARQQPLLALNAGGAAHHTDGAGGINDGR